MHVADAAPRPMSNRRILVIDDNQAIHKDFEKILCPADSRAALRDLEASLFEAPAAPSRRTEFELSFASQGEEGCRRVKAAVDEGRPYALAFIDIRMPPGIDGVETTERIWREDPNLQVVICSAHSDYSWEDMTEKLGQSQRLLILRKPFDSSEVIQLAHALSEKWQLLRNNQQTVEQLNAEVKEQVAQLDAVRRQLFHAQKLDALGRISAGIAHELNNPLAFIISNLRYINDTVRTFETEGVVRDFGDLVDACDETMNGAQRIQRIVRDVKIFARSEAAPTAELRLAPIVEEAVKRVMAEQGAGARLEVDLGDVPPVIASEQGLSQVLISLLTNAVQALIPDAPERNLVRVTSRCEEQGVVIEVSDTGVGIRPEDLPLIFEPFFTTKPIGVGTGLGLSICHGIVKKLGGELSVTSTRGVGTTFRLCLPAAHTERADAHRPARAQAAAPAGA